MISDILWGIGFALAVFEVAGMLRTTKAHCSCGGDPWYGGLTHLKSWGLYTVAGLYAASVLTYGGAVWGKAVVAASAVLYFWRAWKHSKNGRKKLKDKVLGVVRETAAGLRVVPVPGGSGA